MTEVQIPFRPEMVAAILEGRKICTSRYTKYGDPGNIMPVPPKKFEIIGIIWPRLRNVRDYLFGAEGFTSSMEFENYWVKLHPRRGFREEDRVYTHFFEEVQ